MDLLREEFNESARILREGKHSSVTLPIRFSLVDGGIRMECLDKLLDVDVTGLIVKISDLQFQLDVQEWLCKNNMCRKGVK